jgi:hypothetical protein
LPNTSDHDHFPQHLDRRAFDAVDVPQPYSAWLIKAAHRSSFIITSALGERRACLRAGGTSVYIANLFVPQNRSTIEKPHPLVTALLSAGSTELVEQPR